MQLLTMVSISAYCTSPSLCCVSGRLTKKYPQHWYCLIVAYFGIIMVRLLRILDNIKRYITLS